MKQYSKITVVNNLSERTLVFDDNTRQKDWLSAGYLKHLIRYLYNFQDSRKVLALDTQLINFMLIVCLVSLEVYI